MNNKREKLWNKQEGKCYYCARPIRTRTMGFESLPYATLDHVIPRSKGGTWAISNLVVACGDCNTKKSNSVLQPMFKGLAVDKMYDAICGER